MLDDFALFFSEFAFAAFGFPITAIFFLGVAHDHALLPAKHRIVRGLGRVDAIPLLLHHQGILLTRGVKVAHFIKDIRVVPTQLVGIQAVRESL